MNATQEATSISINYMFVRSKVAYAKRKSSVVKININKWTCSSLENITKCTKSIKQMDKNTQIVKETITPKGSSSATFKRSSWLHPIVKTEVNLVFCLNSTKNVVV